MPGKGTTHSRGYGKRHEAERRRWKPKVEAGEVHCWRCRQWIDPAQPWDLGHDDGDRTRYRGPEHPGCNRSAGGTNGARAVNAAKGIAPRVSRQW